MKGIIRISLLLWADILVLYALFALQKYLTDVRKLSFTHAAGILNVWGGISLVLPVLFLFLVDTIMGNFRMLVLSSIAYAMGIGFVTMSTPPVLGVCKKYERKCISPAQDALFYTGMALLAVGIAGHMISIKPFVDEQKDTPDENGSEKKLSVFALVVLIPVIGGYFLAKIKPWSILFGIPAICTTVATILFLTGWCTYRKAKPKGSPLTNVCKVFVASALKKSQPFPLDAKMIYRKDNLEPQSFSRTRFLRCLEKAAIILPNVSLEDQVRSKWRLCSVSEVEEAKIAVRMVPVGMTFIVCGIVSSIGNTYFAEQANRMNHRIRNKKVPVQILLMLFEWAKVLLACFAKKTVFKNFPPAGISIAMIFSVLCCITAAKIETKRLNVIRSYGLLEKPNEEIPMSMFWLLFQFFLLAGLNSFFEESVTEFFEGQAPESMRSYLGYFAKGVTGLGFMCSVLSVYVVGKISGRGGRKSWFQFTLSKSRLDRYYWVLAALSSVNLIMFVLVAWSYRYKDGYVEDKDRQHEENGMGDGNKNRYVEDHKDPEVEDEEMVDEYKNRNARNKDPEVEDEETVDKYKNYNVKDKDREIED